MLRWFLMPLAAAALAACAAPNAEPGYPTRPGRFATAVLPLEDAAQLEWAARFALVEVGDVHEPNDPDLAELRRRGVGVLLYEWMPAGYHYTDGSPDDPFMAWVYPRRESLTLNPEGPFPHCAAAGYGWCEDRYYDLALPELRAKRVAYLAANLEAAQAAGVFFDWGPGVFIEEDGYAPMREAFARRHPDGDYLAAVGDFYAELRAGLPEARLIVSNQGFRNAEHVLPHVDLDMTESYGTGVEDLGRRLYLEGRGWTEVPSTLYYPVSQDFRRGSLRDTLAWLDELDARARAWAGPRFRGFVYMNYAAPDFVRVGALANGTPVHAPPYAAGRDLLRLRSPPAQRLDRLHRNPLEPRPRTGRGPVLRRPGNGAGRGLRRPRELPAALLRERHRGGGRGGAFGCGGAGVALHPVRPGLRPLRQNLARGRGGEARTCR